MIRAAVALATALLALASVAPPTAAAPVCPGVTSMKEMNIIVPAYFYPDATGANATRWDRVLADAAIAKRKGFRLAVIIDPPVNGDFTSVEQPYATIVDRLAAADVLVLGYVHTLDGTRPKAAVQKNIAAYRAIYPKVRGIFVDNAKIDSAHFDYYLALRRAAIREFGGSVFMVGNAAGVPVLAPRFREVFDLTLVYENAGSALSGFVQQDAVKTASPTEIGYVVHSIDQIQAPDEQTRACRILTSLRYANPAKRNAAWWYLTTDADGAPYDSLGNGHDAFLQATCSANTFNPCGK